MLLAGWGETVIAIGTPGGGRLPVGARDRLVLLRAVQAEGAPRPWVAQVLVNRAAWLNSRDPQTWPTVARAVEAYSQPINPRWFPAGDKHAAHVRGMSPAARQVAEKQARRRRDWHAKRVTFTPDTEAAVAQAIDGPLIIPAGALHFARPNAARRASFEVVRAGTRSPRVNEIYRNLEGPSREALYRPVGRRTGEPPPYRHQTAALLGLGSSASLGILLLLGLPLVLRARRWGRD
mgnify:CR=1 FL=1